MFKWNEGEFNPFIRRTTLKNIVMKWEGRRKEFKGLLALYFFYVQLIKFKAEVKMKAVIYLRVSTQEQSLGMQEQAIKRYCEVQSIKPIKTFRDVGFSGSKESRPEFDKMLNSLRAKEFDTLIVYKLDRIGRSLSHLVKLFEEFKVKKISFISITQNINTSTAEGRMFLQMLMVLAEYERSLTIRRVNDGLARAKANGVKLGRPEGSKDKVRRRRSGYLLRWSK